MKPGEVSGYPGQESVVASGPLAGRGLADLLREFGADLVGDAIWQRWGETFPLLIKFIDAHADLSIQVHPDDDYVRSNGLGRFGKSEAWFVLHSEGGRTALGLTEGVDRGEFSRAIAEGRALDVVEFQDVAPGDVIFVPPGTVHAANAGIVIYEVQQPSDVTFRIYDYNRPGLDGKPRDLHIEQALDVINFEGNAHVSSHYDGLSESGSSAQGATLLVDSDNFRLKRRHDDVRGGGNTQLGDQLPRRHRHRRGRPLLLRVGGARRHGRGFSARATGSRADRRGRRRGGCSRLSSRFTPAIGAS